MRQREHLTTDSYEYYRRQRQRRRNRRWLGFFVIVLLLGGGVFAGTRLLDGIPSISLPTFAPIIEPAVMPTATSTMLPATATPTQIVATAESTVVSAELVSDARLHPPNLPDLQALMLRLINEDRAANQLAPVAWDETLALAGQLHAEEMVVNDYLSHWNLVGHGPDHRYTLAGGQHISRENVHSFAYTFNDGRGAPIDDWAFVIANAQSGFMASAGHRANILTPSHTHVGVGMAYDAASGQFRLAQEFGNQSVSLAQPLPTAIGRGEQVMVVGRISADNLTNLLLNIAYEPTPPPRSLTWLRNSSTYRSPANSIDAVRLGDSFSETITFDYAEGAGVYHIRIFGERAGDTPFLLLNHAIWVGQ